MLRKSALLVNPPCRFFRLPGAAPPLRGLKVASCLPPAARKIPSASESGDARRQGAAHEAPDGEIRTRVEAPRGLGKAKVGSLRTRDLLPRGFLAPRDGLGSGGFGRFG